MSNNKTPITYRDAGVDIDAGDALIDAIKPLARSTQREGCLGGLGGFGALFEVPDRYQSPVLVSGTDGVGTKLKIAFELNRHDTIGIDLVAMCVNDVLVQGAEPLFFLDYFATGKLKPEIATTVVSGIAEGCRQAGAALIGGETAEMPGMYPEGEYDLAGFCVGAVEKSQIIDGSKVMAGDQIIGLPSTGPHSNGYSLIRHLLEQSRINLSATIDGQSFADALLAPTQIYVQTILPLLREFDLHAIAHITGGGLPGNVNRVLPQHLQATIERSNWQQPEIFNWLQQQAAIDDAEMLKTFNCGIGMILVVADNQAAAITDALNVADANPVNLGIIEERFGDQHVIIR